MKFTETDSAPREAAASLPSVRRLACLGPRRGVGEARGGGLPRARRARQPAPRRAARQRARTRQRRSRPRRPL